MRHTFPDFYPQNITVPPADASATTHPCLYRLTCNDPAQQQDFIPTCLEDRSERYKARRRDNPSFYGTSFADNAERLQNLKRLHPDGLGDKVVTSGSVCQSLGVSLVEGEHVSVWFYCGCYPTDFTS